MRVTEEHATLDEVLGEVGGRRRGHVRRRLHALRYERSRTQQPRERGQRQSGSVERVEERLLVLLEVAVVGER